jgi:hypothetical protein
MKLLHLSQERSTAQGGIQVAEPLFCRHDKMTVCLAKQLEGSFSVCGKVLDNIILSI